MSLRHDPRRKKKVQGFEAHGHRKTCKERIQGYGKGSLPEKEGWGKKGEERRLGGTEEGG